MIRGPVEYVPPVELEVLMKRQAIPLDENEGIYVRDIKTGKVRETLPVLAVLHASELYFARVGCFLSLCFVCLW